MDLYFIGLPQSSSPRPMLVECHYLSDKAEKKKKIKETEKKKEKKKQKWFPQVPTQESGGHTEVPAPSGDREERLPHHTHPHCSSGEEEGELQTMMGPICHKEG